METDLQPLKIPIEMLKHFIKSQPGFLCNYSFYAHSAPNKYFYNVKPGIIYTAFFHPGDCHEIIGKQILGAALHADGHMEVRYFIGGQCPWVIYKKPEPLWPEGYEEYGAFTWKSNLYFRKELVQYTTYTYGAEPGPEGYHRAGGSRFCPHTTSFPTWVKTKEF